MPISAGLREDIAVYRGFIGQQYFLNDEDTKHFWTSTAFNGGGQVEFVGIATIFGSQYPNYEYKVRAFIKY